MHTPLILTVELNEEAQIFFNKKRKQYFPAHLNFIEAHLTLFHHLPDKEPAITETVKTVCSQQKQMALEVTEPAGTGKGVAYKTESKALLTLHKKLQKEWFDFLTSQDRQGLWPHVTIQNKVAPQEARQTLQQLKTEFIPFTAYAVGLILWRYLSGPWQLYQQFPFGG